MIKDPDKFTIVVPIGNPDSTNFPDCEEMKYLHSVPIPPPVNSANIFIILKILPFKISLCQSGGCYNLPMNKLDGLKVILRKIGPALIAFSGGADSTFLAAVAKQVLGRDVVLVTAVSETYPRSELKGSVRLAKMLGLNHKIVRTKEFLDKKFVSNTSQRCFYCKKELFKVLKEMSVKMGMEHVLDASNYDDLKDFRPGARAKKMLGVISPLQEAKLTKKDIRRFSRDMKLPTWDKPACACLASRVPYGERITEQKLQMAENAEKYLKKTFGDKADMRVRIHGNIARIELENRLIKGLFKGDIIKKIARKMKVFGFSYVTVDLEGFRSGSMNEVLAIKKKRGGR